jgi:hypothetical protein
VVFFACFQLSLDFLMDRWQPELRDPEYGYKLLQLRERLAAEPGRSLTVVVGSSRAALGFRPDVIPACWPGSSSPPLVFNLALTGSGPILELLCLHRLLAVGIRPQRVIVEVLAPLLHQEEGWGEINWLNINRLGWDDFRLMRRYTDQPGFLTRRWCRSRLTPCFSHRFAVMSRYAAGWLPWDSRQDGWCGMDLSGWVSAVPAAVNAAEYRRGLEFARKQYAPALEHYRITEKPDRALRELLALCREERIAVVLMLMPEGGDFRSWYTPDARSQIDRYVAELSQHFDAHLVDARTWLADSAFWDGHHLLANGAVAFTERFTREALYPLVEERKLATATTP